MNDAGVEQSIYRATELLRDFVRGSISVTSFVENYANFYYYEALDGHEPSSMLDSQMMSKLSFAITLHRRIQEEVVNNVALDSDLSEQALTAVGRLPEREARARARSICADVGLNLILETIEAH